MTRPLTIRRQNWGKCGPNHRHLRSPLFHAWRKAFYNVNLYDISSHTYASPSAVYSGVALYTHTSTRLYRQGWILAHSFFFCGSSSSTRSPLCQLAKVPFGGSVFRPFHPLRPAPHWTHCPTPTSTYPHSPHTDETLKLHLWRWVVFRHPSSPFLPSSPYFSPDTPRTLWCSAMIDKQSVPSLSKTIGGAHSHAWYSTTVVFYRNFCNPISLRLSRHLCTPLSVWLALFISGTVVIVPFRLFPCLPFWCLPRAPFLT